MEQVLIDFTVKPPKRTWQSSISMVKPGNERIISPVQKVVGDFPCVDEGDGMRFNTSHEMSHAVR